MKEKIKYKELKLNFYFFWKDNNNNIDKSRLIKKKGKN